MAGLVTRIREVLNSQLPTDSSLATRVLGISFPLDPFLTGTTRFARKIGDFTSTIMVDNTTSLANAVAVSQQTILTNEILGSVVPGSRLLVQDSELVTVRDFSVDVVKNQMTIHMVETFRTQHPAGSSVVLYGHPIGVDAVQPSTVQVTFPVMLVDGTGAVTGVPGRQYVQLGTVPISIITVTDSATQTPLPYTQPIGTDVVGLPTPPIAGIQVVYEVQQVLAVSSTVPIYPDDDITVRFGALGIESAQLASFINGSYQYVLTLKVGARLPPAAPPGHEDSEGYRPVAGDTIYLRAWPAYQSKPNPIPSLPPTDANLGPFCVDWLSGVTLEETSFEESMHLQLHDSALNPIGLDEKVDKNHLVLREPIRSDAILFWDILRGSVNWNGSETLARPDQLAHPMFEAHYLCRPLLRNDGQISVWRIRFANPNATAAQVVVTLDPAGAQTFVVPAATTQYLKVQVPVGVDIERIYVAFTAVVPDPNDPSKWVEGGSLPEYCRLGGWFVDGSIAQFASYRLICKATGRFKWASCGLLYKPIFLNVEYLRARLDMSATVNNGRIFF